MNDTHISELVYKFTRTGGRNTGRSIQDGQTNIHEDGTSLELTIPKCCRCCCNDDDDEDCFEMLFEADEYLMTVDEKQQI